MDCEVVGFPKMILCVEQHLVEFVKSEMQKQPFRQAQRPPGLQPHFRRPLPGLILIRFA